jgi:hypothetical protein
MGADRLTLRPQDYQPEALAAFKVMAAADLANAFRDEAVSRSLQACYTSEGLKPHVEPPEPEPAPTSAPRAHAGMPRQSTATPRPWAMRVWR